MAIYGTMYCHIYIYIYTYIFYVYVFMTLNVDNKIFHRNLRSFTQTNWLWTINRCPEKNTHTHTFCDNTRKHTCKIEGMLASARQTSVILMQCLVAKISKMLEKTMIFN